MGGWHCKRDTQGSGAQPGGKSLPKRPLWRVVWLRPSKRAYISNRYLMSHALIAQSNRNCTEQIQLQQMSILRAAVIIERELQMHRDVTLQIIDAVGQSKPVNHCFRRGTLVCVGSCILATS